MTGRFARHSLRAVNSPAGPAPTTSTPTSFYREMGHKDCGYSRSHYLGRTFEKVMSNVARGRCEIKNALTEADIYDRSTFIHSYEVHCGVQRSGVGNRLPGPATLPSRGYLSHLGKLQCRSVEPGQQRRKHHDDRR